MKSFSGVVQKGEMRGKRLGFPTANIPLTDDSITGIYAARVILKKDEAPYMAAVYADPKRGVLEAHLLDFENDLYNLPIMIELHEKIRESTSFDDEASLKAAIADDVAKVRKYFTKE